MTLGPLLGALLLRTDFSHVALVGASCYLVTFLLTLLLLPPVQVADEPRRLTYGIALALRDRPFMIFNVLLMGYWFMWVQLSISLPLVARAISGTSECGELGVYAVNAGMSVLLQYPLLRLAERKLRPLPILVLGVAVMALGLGGIALAGSVAALLLCVALFSAGALLASPTPADSHGGVRQPGGAGIVLWRERAGAGAGRRAGQLQRWAALRPGSAARGTGAAVAGFLYRWAWRRRWGWRCCTGGRSARGPPLHAMPARWYDGRG